ncbi:MAG: hypothetical protein CVU06_05385 [Bacteroidetes bacterium HGW-Bacteroidetes-22]|nr:MAG: hypothetical protein CVU06_05385 [Bacteroidetes bacterium HGW-Bacteroidetes-22]
MKRILIVIALLCNVAAFSQNVEVTGGLNSNNFFDFQKNDGHYTSSYNSDYGYVIRVGIDNIKAGWMAFRFTLSYDKYSGELTASDGGLGSGYTTNAKIDKSVISLGVFPLNFRIIDRIGLNFGFELSGLVSENINGTSSGWSAGTQHWSYDLNDKYDRYSSKFYFGLCGRIAYDFKISDKLIISPQYSYYLGLSDEFDEFPESTKAMRHYFCLGLKRKIK